MWNNWSKLNPEKAKASRRAWRLKNAERDRENNKIWKKAHPDKTKETRKKYIAANKEYVRAAEKAYRKAHPDIFKKAQKKWWASHPDITKRLRHEREMRKKNVTVETFIVSEIFDRDGWICQLCRKKVNKKRKYPDPLSASLDHIIPLIYGGEHSRMNVQLAHLRCNVSAGKRGIKQLRLF